MVAPNSSDEISTVRFCRSSPVTACTSSHSAEAQWFTCGAKVRGTAYVQYWPAGASYPAPLVRKQEAATRIKYVQYGGAGTYVSTQWFTHLPFGTMWMSNVSRIQTW